MQSHQSATKTTKGIILAGGSGTRLYPVTSLYSKQLVSVYDKPMIYYPLSTLIQAGIKDVLIISNELTLPSYKKLFGDGSHLGMNISYALQQEPKGIAEALIIGEEFIGEDQVALILGDNIFYGPMDFLQRALAENENATIFGYYVKEPEQYGVVEFANNGQVLSLEEKPVKPKSHFAVPGLYIYDSSAPSIAKQLQPSGRGELEITDLNKAYLEDSRLKVEIMSRGIAWLDSGTPDSLLDTSNFVASVEKRQGLKIGCIEEMALESGFIGSAEMEKIISSLPKCDYREYLQTILNEQRNS